MFFALALALWFLKRLTMSIQSYYAFITITVLSSTIPDLDLKLKHRKTLHNIVVPSLIVLAVYTAMPQVLLLGIALLLGWLSHIVLDALTTKGIYPLHPLINRKLALKLCKSEDPAWNLIITLLSLLIIVTVYVK